MLIHVRRRRGPSTHRGIARRLQIESLERREVLSASPLVDSPAPPADLVAESVPVEVAVAAESCDAVAADVPPAEMMAEGEADLSLIANELAANQIPASPASIQYEYNSPQPLDMNLVDQVLAEADPLPNSANGSSSDRVFIDVGVDTPLEGQSSAVMAEGEDPGGGGQMGTATLESFESVWVGGTIWRFEGTVSYSTPEDLWIEFGGLLNGHTTSVTTTGEFAYLHDFGYQPSGDVSAVATDDVIYSNTRWAYL